MIRNRAIGFFETQFDKQIRTGALALNPFETLALPFLRGQVLELGCGLGNMSLEAARRGCSVLALDGCANAVSHIAESAQAERLSVEAQTADLATYRITGKFDAIAAIGLLMFFPRDRALEILEDIMSHVRPGGCAILNVLIEGTTYLDMFEPNHYYLFGRTELQEKFADWNVLLSQYREFEAPGGKLKSFVTLVARQSGNDIT